MDRYLDAGARSPARRATSRLPVMVNIHRMDDEHPQDSRVDELPFGTRGGLAVRSDFPVDGTYASRSTWAAQPRDLQDWRSQWMAERVRIVAARRKYGPWQGRAWRAGVRPLEFRHLPLKAGPKLIGHRVRPAQRHPR